MSVRRGDIVLVPIPFTAGTGGKVWPALVVHADRNNAHLNDTIFAIITTTTHRALNEPTQLLLDVATPDDRQSVLLHTSAVKCEHLATIEQWLILRVISSVPASTMTRVNACLKASLALP